MLIATALIAQALFWFYSMPGPQIRGHVDLASGVVTCLVSGLVLLLIPLLVATSVLKRTPKQLGLSKGDVSFGWKAMAICVPVMAIGTLMGSADPQIQNYYPIPGDAIGESLTWLLSWWLAYLLFYVSFEFFYRGFLLNGLTDLQTGTQIVGFIGLQAVCCFLIHIGKPNAELMASLPASIAFGWIAWRARSIWYGVLIHFAVGIANDLGALWQG